MKTASYFTFRGPGRIGISRGMPPAFASLPTYEPLLPSAALLHGAKVGTIDQDRYERYYRSQLRNLNAEDVRDDLLKLAGGAEPVLLCWERPPFTGDNWCHRRMAAAWLQETLGLEVLEWEPPSRDRPAAPQLGLFGSLVERR